MGNPWQNVIDWLAGRWDALLAALNPINLIISIAAYFASLLPAPDPRIADIVNTGVAALDTVVKFISLADYLINLPVLIILIVVIVGAKTILNVYRGWRIIRSAVT